MYWPGVDKWPPSPKVLVAALLITIIAFGLVLIVGAIGTAIYLVFLIVCLVLGANQRLKNMGAEDFWNSRPKD